jgi:MYXO-CTERM domain-containing protein
MRSFRWLAPALLLVPFAAQAEDPPGDGYHPWAHTPKVRTLDVSEAAINPEAFITAPVEQPDFWNLDAFALPEDQRVDEIPPARDPGDTLTAELPDGWVQRGNVVLPQAVADGLVQVGTGPIHAVEDIPGNKYPRKHTLFLNFNGGMLYSGKDNSAENYSTLARHAVYPTFGGGESTALSIVQAVENDVAPYGIRVIYDFRPRKLVPYTMEMVGGSWMDTNIDSPAGGVAPGADCGALGQRHVVYTFSNGGSVTGAANTISQEAGHAWGLDHTFNCGSVMSYCGGGDGSFQNSCDGLCESQCQGPNSAGCQLTHEMFCGEGSLQQNDHLEMQWIFGGNEPDMEPPTVEIVNPPGDIDVEAGASVNMRAMVDDNYGGFGWRFVVTKDGETIYDEPDYDRDVDEDYLAALNLVNLEPGVYTVLVEAEDQFEQIASDMVTVNVGMGSASGGETDGGGSGTDGSASGSASASGGSAEGGLESDGGDEESDGGSDTDTTFPEDNLVDNKGCGCAAGSGGGPASVLGLLLVGLGAHLRRRRTRTA